MDATTESLTPEIRTETMVLNMGPQHPSTHGVLRLVLDLEGETVVRCVPHLGYLHTGFEKTFEDKTYHQCIPITDRMDYLAPLSNNLALCLGVEKLLGIEAPERAQYLRVILVELQRICSHLVWLGTHSLDLGAVTPFWYTFRERDQILDLFEELSGVRMMTSHIRIGGLALDVPPGWIEKLRDFLAVFPSRVDDYEGLLTRNPVFLQRARGVGELSAADAIALGASGPVARASGVAHDLRKAEPYCVYDRFEFDIPVGERGDVYDRYRVRIAEMRESHRIITQALEHLPEGDYKIQDWRYTLPPREAIKRSMEELIYHFKFVTEGIRPPAGEVYRPIEGPKGEIGFYLVSDGSPRPLRCRVRPPSFINLQALPKICEGRLVADLVAILGSIDIVLGEVDR
ncbi:MAG TPA: NADH dehydrogenase (quinone) subunit D [Armatimonadetes bacterium]|nr:NADH dehydrogenase (quinone) subunit D [Armatimonadota bacterium]